MEDIELQKIWAEYDRKLEESRVLNLQSWALNLKSFEAIQMQKAKTKLNRLASFKIGAVVLGIVWVLFLSFLIFNRLTWQGIIFNISAGMIVLITAIAIIVYIKHVVLIRQIDNSENIVDTQRKLALLQSSTIRIIGILWLQLPFYATFFLTPSMLYNWSMWQWLIVISVTGLFTIAALWLYKNISYKNKNKKWFRVLFNSTEWTSVTRAMFFLDEIEEFKKNN